MRTQPRWAGVTGFELGAKELSAWVDLLVFNFRTGARNRVSLVESGGSSRGTDKDLINRSKSRPFWQSARTLRSRIAVGGGRRRGLSLTLSLRPQHLPRHCGTPEPEMANGVPRPIWAPEIAAGARPEASEQPWNLLSLKSSRSREGL